MRSKRWVVAWVAWAGCIGPPLTVSTTEPTPTATPEPVERAARPARAFAVTRATDLLDGGAAEGRVGDYRIDNDLVAVIVSAPGHAFGFAESGGNVIDAAPAGGHDALGQVYGYLGDTFPRQPIYDRVDVVDRGTTAALIARGHDSDNPALAVETEYALAPGARTLRITSTLTNEGKQALEKLAVGDAVDWGRAERFVPHKGLDSSGRVTVDAGWVAGFADDAAYAYAVGDGPLDARNDWEWTDFNAQVVDLPAGASIKFQRWLVIGAPTDTTLYEALATLRKARWSRLSGRILEEATGEPLAGARVTFDDRGPVAMTRSTAQGYSVLLPAGDYRVHAEGIGRTGPSELEVTVSEGGGASHDVIMSKKGTVAFHVREGGAPLPARLSFFGVAPTRDPYLGPPFAAVGGNVVASATGDGEIAMPPGSYRVLVSRGPQYSLEERHLDVVGGETATLEVELKRVVDAFGWRCFDPHQHAAPSADSAVSLADRVASNLAEGLDVVVATDHNAVSGDWAGAVAELHAPHPPTVILGDEVSIERFGHFSVIPWTAEPATVRGRAAREVLRGLKGTDRVVILNHPRAGGRTGYFENVGLDEKGGADLGAFDAVEVFSGKDTTRVEPPLRDWLALLDRGLPLTAVGGSDSHLVAGQEVGWPRTCIPVEGNGVLDAAALVGALGKRHEALVTNGPFVHVSVAGHGMGQLAPAPRGRAKLDLEVDAAPWIDVRRIELFINGSRRGKPIDVPPSTSMKVQRYKGSIDLRLERDAYVVVIARGDIIGPVLPAAASQSAPTALAITNPIYLDRDGDGKWTPPNAKPNPK
ncbi:MAG TPA: CehA/McbA family metallohydrolase [Polyangia bacterium]|nr:CehA/McbA family metallohydrolase [Polyangia bacterium]